ncbi:MAG: tetratricopeptide repeat protein [Pseudomonadota bacterium]|nr:tetratricopeptide repeat protein [Pseudomonadota bacterium]
MMNLNTNLFKPAEDLVNEGKLAEAAEVYRSVIFDAPGHPFAHHNYAILLRKLNQIEEAIEQSQRAYELFPDNPTIILSLGLSLEMGGFFEKAEKFYKKSLKLNPNYTAALNNLGHILDHTDRPLEALPILQKAHQLSPHDNNVLLNLANVYLSLGRPTEAEKLIKEIKTAASYNSLGIARYVQRDWIGAKTQFKKALSIEPNFAGAHENLALTLLHLKDFEAGWIEYDWRWKNTANRLTKPIFNKPVWSGGQLAGKNLLLHSEQGFGDAIQFIRYAGLIKKSGGKIFLACQSELLDLLKDAPGIDEAYILGSQIPDYDFHAPLLSLPRITECPAPEQTTIKSYLNVSVNREQPRSLNEILKIGICWAGRPRHVHDPYRNRRCPVNLFETLAQIPRTRLYNLQYNQSFIVDSSHIPLMESFRAISNFQDTADAISKVDLVVSIDTAVIHLTGAMGKPGIVLLNYAADWRWGKGFGTAPWYPSIQMFRQVVPGNWKNVFDQVSTFIKQTYFP